MYTFNTDNSYTGTYLKTTNVATNDEITVVNRLIKIMNATKKSSNPEKDKIYSYFKKSKIFFRFKKKFIDADFDKIESDIVSGKRGVTEQIERDFEGIFGFAIAEIQKEPLILNFPLKGETNTTSYFIPCREKQTTNEKALKREIGTALERFHRISASLQDEYIVFFIQQLFASEYLYSLLNEHNYRLNYDLIYKNFEELDPYAFENMEKEMFKKYTYVNIMKDPNYLPNNKIFRLVRGVKYPTTDEFIEHQTSESKIYLNNELDNTSHSTINPLYDTSVVKLATQKLYEYLESPRVKGMVKSGELFIEYGLMCFNVNFGKEHTYKYLEKLIDTIMYKDQIEAYLEYTKIENLAREM